MYRERDIGYLCGRDMHCWHQSGAFPGGTSACEEGDAQVPAPSHAEEQRLSAGGGSSPASFSPELDETRAAQEDT